MEAGREVEIEICPTTSGHCHIHIVGVGLLRVSRSRLRWMMQMMDNALASDPVRGGVYQELFPDVQFFERIES